MLGVNLNNLKRYQKKLFITNFLKWIYFRYDTNIADCFKTYNLCSNYFFPILVILLLLYKDEGHHILQRFYDCTLDIKRVTAPDTRYAHSFYHPLRGEFEKKVSTTDFGYLQSKLQSWFKQKLQPRS